MAQMASEFRISKRVFVCLVEIDNSRFEAIVATGGVQKCSVWVANLG